MSDLVPFHSGQVRNFYLLVLGVVNRKYIIYNSVFTKLFRHRKAVITVNSEIFVRILFSRIAFKDIFATLKNCD